MSDTREITYTDSSGNEHIKVVKANRWTNHGKDRIYFEVEESHLKTYIDLKTGEWDDSNNVYNFSTKAQEATASAFADMIAEAKAPQGKPELSKEAKQLQNIIEVWKSLSDEVQESIPDALIIAIEDAIFAR